MSHPTYNLIIIGSGPAGLTAAVYAARSNLEPLIIDGSMPGGQLMKTSYVENWPGNSRILGPDLMKNLREHAQTVGAKFLAEEVEEVDFSQKPFILRTNRNTTLSAHTLIIATGATPKKLDVPGEEKYWGKGVTTCAVCDGAFYPDKRVLVIGGGDTAMEDASFLKKFTNKITIVQILPSLTASHAMKQRVINDPDITIMYNSTVTAFRGNETHVTGTTIVDQKTQKKTELPVDGVFIAIGLQPNTVPFKEQLSCDKWGFIQVSNHTKTSVDGVFAAGDVHDFRYRQAITAAGAGCMAALDVERYLQKIGTM